MRTKTSSMVGSEGDDEEEEDHLWYLPWVVRLPPPPPPPPPPNPSVSMRPGRPHHRHHFAHHHHHHPPPPPPPFFDHHFGTVHHFPRYHPAQREYYIPPTIGVALSRKRPSIVATPEGPMRRLLPPPSPVRRPAPPPPPPQLVSTAPLPTPLLDTRFHIRRPSLRQSPWASASLDGGTIACRTFGTESSCNKNICRNRKSSKGKGHGGSVPTSPNGLQPSMHGLYSSQTPPDSPFSEFPLNRTYSSNHDLTAHSSSTGSVASAFEFDGDLHHANSDEAVSRVAEDKEDGGESIGSRNKDAGNGDSAGPSQSLFAKYRRNPESQARCSPLSRCCSGTFAASGGSSSAKLRRRRTQGHICPHCKGRPLSLDVTTLSEGDEEGDEAGSAQGSTTTDSAAAQQGPIGDLEGGEGEGGGREEKEEGGAGKGGEGSAVGPAQQLAQDWRRLLDNLKRRVKAAGMGAAGGGRGGGSGDGSEGRGGGRGASASTPAPSTSSSRKSGLTPPPSLSLASAASSSSGGGKNSTSSPDPIRDDFLRATMRIFLVVSPPMGRMQGRSRSLTHIDSLDPAMLVKAAAAAAVATDSKNGGETSSSTADVSGGLAASGSGIAIATAEDLLPGAEGLGPSRHLSGSAEFPAPSQDRLIVPGGGGAGVVGGLGVGGYQESKMRRQKLTRSQVSSSEYFSVSFECLEEPGPEEFIPAAKGTTLADALSSVCARKGIDLNNVNVFQDSIKRPLPIYGTETSRLGGKHLKIKAKDEKSPSRSLKGSSSQGPTRKTSGSYKGKGNKFFSASTEDPSYVSESQLPSHEGSLKGPSKGSKQRWSGLFGNNKDTRMGTLAETLDNYSKNGIPKLPPDWDKKKANRESKEHSAEEQNESYSEEDVTEMDGGGPESEDEILHLEEDWREVIGGDLCAAQLTEREMQQQTAIWELLATEAAYIKTLKVVTDLFLACLLSLQSSGGILTEVDTERLFSNIQEIHSANFHFWKKYLLPMVKDARKRSSLQNQALNASSIASVSTGYPVLLDPKIMKEGFLKFGDVFHTYTKYCGDQARCQQYCREKIHENELFTAYLAWCETRKECNRLRLQDIVVKPMQRLTKYSLLLKAIQRHTENANDIESLDQMIKAVDEFVNGVNTTLKQRQDQERLRGIIARIESYDVVETKDDEMEKLVKIHSELDLNCPMPGCNPSQRRHLLLEADLRLRDHATSKTDVHIFLFTDMLLICKPVTKKSGGGGGGGGGNIVGGGGSSGAVGLVAGGVVHGGVVAGVGSSGSGSDRMLKVIRQPFVVDRLVVKEASSGNGLSLVYLNEFNVATAALTLSASEPKVIKSLNEGIRKAQDQYGKSKAKARSDEADEAVAVALAANVAAAPPSPHAPKLSALSPFDSANSSCCLCFYEDGGGGGGGSVAASVGMGELGSGVGQGLIPSCPRSPRCGSSRGSRLSSLAHSHSGSMEMNEVSSGGGSACQSRGISVETMTDLRGSSLSSDEGSNSATAAGLSDSGTSIGGRSTQLPPPPPPPPSTSTSTPSLHQIPSVPPTSPRPERRAVLCRSPTPNTLSVLVPYASTPVAPTSPNSSTSSHPIRTYLGGQSLPNLSSMAAGSRPANAGAPSPSGSSQHHHHHSPSTMFLVPPSRSPPPPPIGVNQRGISYPPPSPPRSLRRGYAVVNPPVGQISRNPPLTKTRHVGSVGPNMQSFSSFSCSIGVGGTPEDLPNQVIGTVSAEMKSDGDKGSDSKPSVNLDFEVPVIGGVQPPSSSENTSSLSQDREDSGVVCGEGSGAEVTSSSLSLVAHESLEMQGNKKSSLDAQAAYEVSMNSRQGLMKRLGRGGERQDNRRYHTAGAIDDIKKQDGRDTSIHKRLSWNCGSNNQQGQQLMQSEVLGTSQDGHQLNNPPPFLVGSFESMQSSSGVSSARSSNAHLPGAGDDGEESIEGIMSELDSVNPAVAESDERWSGDGETNHSLFSPSSIGGAFLKALTPDFFRDITSSSKCTSSSQVRSVEDNAWVDDVSGETLPPMEAINEKLLHEANNSPTNNEAGSSRTNFLPHENLPPCVESTSSSIEGDPSSPGGSAASCTSPSRPTKADLLRMKDFILTDSSIEASDV